jgi:hypothetical protein
MDYKIKKGQEFLCIKTLIHKNKDIPFYKGNVYRATLDDIITCDYGVGWTIYGIETDFSSNFLDHFDLINIHALERDIAEPPEQIGIKESDGKLNIEYDWDFLKAQMNRMAKNKAKYPKYNWKKPMDIHQLKDALFRHTLEVMNDNFDDEGVEYDHLPAIALNALFIYYQLKTNKQ